jgi:hypothetical protein
VITANAALLKASVSAVVNISSSNGPGTSFTIVFSVSTILVSVTPNTVAITIQPGAMQHFSSQFQALNATANRPYPGLPTEITKSDPNPAEPNTPWLTLDTPAGTFGLVGSTDDYGNFGFMVDARKIAASSTPLTAALAVDCYNCPNKPSVMLSVTVQSLGPALTFLSPQLSLNAVAGQISVGQPLVLASRDGTPLSYTAHGPSWLQIGPPTGTVATDPAQLLVGVDGTQLSAGQKNATLTFSCVAQAACASVSIPVTVSVAPSTVNEVAAHLADGNGWRTELVLVNDGQIPASYTVNFVGDNGSPLSTSVVNQGKSASFAGVIPVGGSRTLQSDGSPATTQSGWAQISSMQGVSGLAIFQSNLQPQLQEAAVPLQYAGAAQLMFPYNNDAGSVTGVAIAAPGGSQQSIAPVQRNPGGQPFAADPPWPIPANGHNDWIFPADFGQGVAEIDSPNGSPIYGLGIRFSNFHFTSIDGVRPAFPSTKIVPQVVDEATARTTFMLVNTDVVPATFTINFWADNGTALRLPFTDGTSASTITNTIPVGGSQVIQTLGANTLPASVEGWAEVISAQSLGGTAVFSYQATGQEAAVPLQPRGGNSMVLPFDNAAGQVLGIAVANVDAAQDATVTETIRDENGTPLSQRIFPVNHHQHTAFLLGSPAGIPASVPRGVVQYDSNVEVYVLGIRYNGGAFTTVRPLNILQ